MPTTPTGSIAARPELPAPIPRPSSALRRLVALALLAAGSGLAVPAAAGEPARPRGEPARGGGALLLLSFLVPLPLPMALVAPPRATRAPRAPVDPCTASPRADGCVAVRVHPGDGK